MFIAAKCSNFLVYLFLQAVLANTNILMKNKYRNNSFFQFILSVKYCVPYDINK